MPLSFRSVASREATPADRPVRHEVSRDAEDGSNGKANVHREVLSSRRGAFRPQHPRTSHTAEKLGVRASDMRLRTNANWLSFAACRSARSVEHDSPASTRCGTRDSSVAPYGVGCCGTLRILVPYVELYHVAWNVACGTFEHRKAVTKDAARPVSLGAFGDRWNPSVPRCLISDPAVAIT